MASVPIYPQRKSRKLSKDEKTSIRVELEKGNQDIYVLAEVFCCSTSQIAGLKAWMKR